MTVADQIEDILGDVQHKFKPKLDHYRRCQVLALSRKGVPRVVIAEIFGVDPRTVSHITSYSSPHYKNVRAEMKGLGEKEFIAQYIDEELVNRVAAVKGDAPTINEARAEAIANAPSPRAARMAGSHRVQPEQCLREHAIEIRWLDPDKDGSGVDQAGWYYRDISSEMPDTWLRGDDISIRTSRACYDSALINLVD